VFLLNDSAVRVADVLSDVGEKDALFVVDFRRRLKLLGLVVAVAKEAGAQVVLLTDSPVSSLARTADVVLSCTTAGSAIFDSYVAPMSIVNYLGASLVAKMRPLARRRMERTEHIHKLISDLVEG
jgi:DNA-binding MurR/RpiR family transcriptional regulator